MKRVNRKILSAAARRGFTMAEAAVAMVIVSVLLVAALRATSASALTQYKTAEKATGLALAQGLMSDIIALPYQEPSGTPNFGLETGESATNRANYDDVDDYNGWNQSPPQDKSGTVIPGLTGWTQIVAVAWVQWSDTTATSSTETGVKRITVTIQHNNRTVATLTGIRTNAP